MLYCRLIYMLSILCVRLTIKVKVGIPESFKVGWYPLKKTGSSHLKVASTAPGIILTISWTSHANSVTFRFKNLICAIFPWKPELIIHSRYFYIMCQELLNVLIKFQKVLSHLRLKHSKLSVLNIERMRDFEKLIRSYILKFHRNFATDRRQLANFPFICWIILYQV